MRFFERRRLVNGLLVASLMLHAATFAYLANSGGLRRIMMKLNLAAAPPPRLDFQRELESRYRKLPKVPGGVVFAGDSLIAGGPWAEFYSPIHNRGIGGESTSGFLGRLGDVIGEGPRKAFLLLGSNDLAAGAPPSQIIENYRAILGRFRAESPSTALHVIGLTPVNRGFEYAPNFTNDQVREVNRRLAGLVAEFPGVRFVDLTDLLGDAAGDLRRDYTPDGLHLAFEAYLAIRGRLDNLVLEAPGPSGP